MASLPRFTPDRMIVLSILPPPGPGQPRVPFGFGALIVEQAHRGEARFELHAHGFGAGYRAQALRERLQALFTPDTMAIILNPVREFRLATSPDRDMEADRVLEHVPRSGLRTHVRVSVPHHALGHAAGMSGAQLPSRMPSPLARMRRIDAEAQAVWVYYLFAQPTSTARRRLFASFKAWQQLQRARRTAVV